MQEGSVYVEELCKEYKILNKRDGLHGSIMDLFSRKYKVINAVNNLNFTIFPGDIVGFLGPNGSGKSTTIKMMTGILKPTKGNILLNGINPFEYRSKIANEIGVVFGQRTQLWWALPVIESFKVIKEMYEIDDNTYKENLKLFEDLTGIQQLYNKPIRQLSLGQRTLCEILSTFLHNPKVVFLDEPTIGLDVTIKEKIHNLIIKFNKIKNTTIILTTHDIADIEAICKKVIIINNGDKIYDCSIDELKKRFNKYRTIKIMIDTKMDKEDIEKRLGLFLSSYQMPYIKSDGNWIELLIDEDKLTLVSMLNILNNLNFIKDIAITNISVESIVKNIYEGIYEKSTYKI